MDDSQGALDCYCFATRQLARHVSKLYDRHLSSSGVTSTQFSILNFLHETPELTTSQLAKSMVMDRTTLVRALKPLQLGGYVFGTPGLRDPRQLALSVTPLGMRKIAEVGPLWMAAQKEYENQIGASKAMRLRSEFLSITA
jgi:DNA-binding MarR family transcriptional regulator